MNSLAHPMQTADILKDTLCHGVYIQSLEVRCGEVLLELFPKVKERVEIVWDQDVLEGEEVKRTDVNTTAVVLLPSYWCLLGSGD